MNSGQIKVFLVSFCEQPVFSTPGRDKRVDVCNACAYVRDLGLRRGRSSESDCRPHVVAASAQHWFLPSSVPWFFFFAQYVF